jgi:hypothetical protein
MGIFPVGSTVELATRELAVVAESNPDPDRIHQPKVRIITDANHALVSPLLVNLTHHDQAARSILHCVDPEKFGINSAHYVF